MNSIAELQAELDAARRAFDVAQRVHLQRVENLEYALLTALQSAGVPRYRLRLGLGSQRAYTNWLEDRHAVEAAEELWKGVLYMDVTIEEDFREESDDQH